MVDPLKVDKETYQVLDEIERHIKQTHTHAFDVGFDAGYRRALCHFGGCLQDMKKLGDNSYKCATFQMCVRHEEMVALINDTPIKDVIGGKEGKWKEFEMKDSPAAEGLAALFG